MSWKEVNLHPDEPFTPYTGKNWRYEGEVLLSMRLGISDEGPRYEITRIIQDQTAVALLVNPEDRDRALEQVSKGGIHIAEPFWYGYSPNAVRGFCRASGLPTPEGYAKPWRQMRRTAMRS